MGIPCSLDPLGSLRPYKNNTILCNISNGQTAAIILHPGIYYIRAQGGGQVE